MCSQLGGADMPLFKYRQGGRECLTSCSGSPRGRLRWSLASYPGLPGTKRCLLRHCPRWLEGTYLTLVSSLLQKVDNPCVFSLMGRFRMEWTNMPGKFSRGREHGEESGHLWAHSQVFPFLCLEWKCSVRVCTCVCVWVCVCFLLRNHLPVVLRGSGPTEALERCWKRERSVSKKRIQS